MPTGTPGQQKFDNGMTAQQENKKELYARHGKATDALAAINRNRVKEDRLNDAAYFVQAGVKVTISNYSVAGANIGVNMNKLLLYAVALFTEQYEQTQSGSSLYEVNFTIDDYIQIVGGVVPADAGKRRRKRNDMQKRVRRELMLLQSVQVTQINGNDYESVSLICRTAAQNGIVTVEFSRPFAEYLLRQAKTIIHPQLLKVGGRSPTAFALGLKITEHHYMNAKRQTKAANRLKVKNLLKVSPLPTYESVLKDGKSWKERIRQPFEKAMNELITTGVLHSWRYESSEAAEKYHSFYEALITFKLAGKK